MTSKELVMAAANHQATGRTPITFDAQPEVFDALYRHFGHRSRQRLFDQLHCDTWMVLPENYMATAEQASKEIKTTIWGWQTIVTQYTGGKYDELYFSPLAGKDSFSDIDNYPWPQPSVQDFSKFSARIAAQKDRAIIAASSWGAYFTATHIRGMEGVMMDLASDDGYAERLIRTISERILAMLDNMLDNHGDGIDIVYMADDYCSQRAPLFSPATFKRLVTPYLKQVVDRAHRKGKKFLLHVCGAVRQLLPMIIDCGVDMLEPIQVRAEGMEPAGLKRDFGKDLCFYGGIDLQQVLCKGTPQSVADEVRRLIDVLGKGGGYIVGPGHTYIQIDAPMANVLSMYETAYSYRPHGRG